MRVLRALGKAKPCAISVVTATSSGFPVIIAMTQPS